MESTAPPRIMVAVAALSAATLGYEVLLTRLLAIVQWHHFAFMVISVALLGFGMSGTFLVLLGTRIRVGIEPFLAGAALGFAVTALACFAMAERVPFNVLEAPWSFRSLGWLVIIELLLTIPFFIAATGIGRAIVALGDRLSRVYAADLLGAGVGAVAVVGTLYRVPPERALHFVAALAASAAAVAIWRHRGRARGPLLLVAAVVLVSVGTGVGDHGLAISPFKPLPQALRVTGAELTETRIGPLGVVSAVENRRVPFRWAPGLSLTTPVPVVEQVALFVDADGPVVIARHHASSPPPVYLDYLTSALPYRMLDRPRVLVLGAGGGTAVLQALGGGAHNVEAVEIQAPVVALVRDRYREFSGGIYTHPAVRVHVADARAFIERTAREFDLVQVTAFGSSTAGVHALSEQRVLTVESVRAMLTRLSSRGLVAITGWSRLPPRDGPRLLATVLAALEAEAVRSPGNHLAWIRSWNTTTLVAGRSPLTARQIASVRAFARERSFDLIHIPGIARDEVNRYNVLERPDFYTAAQRLLSSRRAAYLRGYKFDIRPATDDRPYFSSFFKWAHAPEVVALSRKGGIGLLDVGYLTALAALVQSVLASAVLILVPLLVLRAGPHTAAGARRVATLGAFFCIGLAFLFMEIAFIGRFTVILSHPVQALAVVLAAFLVFAGLGSHLAGRGGAQASITWPIAGIAAIASVYAALFPILGNVLIGLPTLMKMLATIALVAPLATLMGMPFPRALRRLHAIEPGLVPWAWGINGCASVIGAVGATLLAIQFGQILVIVCAACLYVAAAACISRIATRWGGGATACSPARGADQRHHRLATLGADLRARDTNLAETARFQGVDQVVLAMGVAPGHIQAEGAGGFICIVVESLCREHEQPTGAKRACHQPGERFEGSEVEQRLDAADHVETLGCGGEVVDEIRLEQLVVLAGRAGLVEHRCRQVDAGQAAGIPAQLARTQAGATAGIEHLVRALAGAELALQHHTEQHRTTVSDVLHHHVELVREPVEDGGDEPLARPVGHLAVAERREQVLGHRMCRSRALPVREHCGREVVASRRDIDPAEPLVGGSVARVVLDRATVGVGGALVVAAMVEQAADAVMGARAGRIGAQDGAVDRLSLPGASEAQ